MIEICRSSYLPETETCIKICILRSSLVRLSCETTARLAIDAVLRAIRDGGGRSGDKTDKIFAQIRTYLHSELPTAVVKEVLDVCLARDRFRCHHNPTDCGASSTVKSFQRCRFPTTPSPFPRRLIIRTSYSTSAVFWVTFRRRRRHQRPLRTLTTTTSFPWPSDARLGQLKSLKGVTTTTYYLPTATLLFRLSSYSSNNATSVVIYRLLFCTSYPLFELSSFALFNHSMQLFLIKTTFYLIGIWTKVNSLSRCDLDRSLTSLSLTGLGISKR